jgi:DNA-binding XRE family transcriptional regulator
MDTSPTANDSTVRAAMSHEPRITITSIFQTLRPCLRCNTEFYPPKRPDRLILDYCSSQCEREAGLRAMKRGYEDRPRPRTVQRTRAGAPDRSYGPQIRPGIVRSTFARNTIHHRMLARLTQADLALRIGVSKRAVETWETDRANPSPQHLAAMADLFSQTSGQRVTMDDLWRSVPVTGAERVEVSA